MTSDNGDFSGRLPLAYGLLIRENWKCSCTQDTSWKRKRRKKPSEFRNEKGKAAFHTRTMAHFKYVPCDTAEQITQCMKMANDFEIGTNYMQFSCAWVVHGNFFRGRSLLKLRGCLKGISLVYVNCRQFKF